MIESDLRFISHHDTMRLFERALARTGLPIRFSEGFNPRPRLSLPLPRSVGMASQAELLLIELTEPLAPSVVLDRLAEQSPGGLVLAEAWTLAGTRPPQPRQASYRIPLPPEIQQNVTEVIERIDQAETWLIERESQGKRPARAFDLKEQLVEAKVQDGSLCWTMRVEAAGTIRAAEFIAAAGLAPGDWLSQLCRTEVIWDFADQASADEPTSPTQ
jgi:radical SAM-linked protein